MLIFERSVTKAYWEPRYRTITRQHQRGKSYPVGRSGVTCVLGTGKGLVCYYAIFNSTPKGPRPIGWLMLRQKPSWVAWEVVQLWVFPLHRGEGVAKRLYKAAINTDGLLLASGKTHTKHSKALWESFIRTRAFNIWAHEVSNLKKHCSVMWDADEGVVSRLSLYTQAHGGDKMVRDVRLVAQRKDRTNDHRLHRPG